MAFVSHLMGLAPLLESLSMVGNNIGIKGAVLIAESMPHTPLLSELNLAMNQIEDAGMTAIAYALSKDTSLSHLDVSENGLTDACTKSISMYLAGHGSRLTRVNFSQNLGIGNGIAYFAMLLMSIQPPRIECIDLSCCGLTDDVYVDLAKAIVSCKSLRVLNLKGNFILPPSVSALLAASEAHQQAYGRDFIPSRYKLQNCTSRRLIYPFMEQLFL